MQQEELCSLKVKNLESRQSVIHFKVMGKRGKIRFVQAHPQAQRLIESYLLMDVHSMRTMAATNALSQEAGIAKVQES